MRRKNFWSLLFMLAVLSTPLFSQESPETQGQFKGRGTLFITVNGLKDTTGNVRLYLFNSREGFPSKPDRALIARKIKVTGPEVELQVANLPYGMYAVAAHHDVNGNNKLDTNWMHIPKEPTGASNDARSKFGPPKFDKAKFELASDSLHVIVTVK
jgi:uncharacterized protein (DUF2141 family)